MSVPTAGDPTGTPPGPTPRVPAPGWVAPCFAVFAVGLVPWIGYLAVTLPHAARTYQRLPWVGFDVGLMVALGATAVLAWRGSPRVAFAAAVTATMLVVDAWFDVTSSIRASDVIEASALSVVELALAGVCVWIAHHAEVVVRTNVRLLLRRRAAEPAASRSAR